jgi:hypothetical protein
MKILNPAALKRADLERLGKYLAANGVKEISLTRDDGLQTVKRQSGGWQVAIAEVVS